MLKACSKCGIQKELNVLNFAKKPTGIDGFDSMCKACKKKSDHEWYLKNKDKISKEKAEYYRLNRDKIKKLIWNITIRILRIFKWVWMLMDMVLSPWLVV